jgi:hypothetical protein
VRHALDACARARMRYAELFGHAAPAGRLTLSEQAGFVAGTQGPLWIFQWPVESRLREEATASGRSGASLDEFLREEWRETLPHEIGHVMLAADFFPNGGASRPGEYATILPDWFDESVAIWMEPDALRAQRLERARQIAPPPIAAVLAHRHPQAAESREFYSTRIVTRGPCAGDCIGVDRPDETQRVRTRIRRDGTVVVDTVYSSPSATNDDVVGSHFYEYSLAALTYVSERGGRRATAELGRRLRANPALTLPLLGLPGLPNDSTALEADWRRWLLASRR